MDLAKIDLASLPGLETANGLFGSAMQSGATYDDRIVVIMVYLYDTIPPAAIV